jgi:hypothetical protein
MCGSGPRTNESECRPAFDEPLNVDQPVLCRLDLIHKDMVVQVGWRPERRASILAAGSRTLWQSIRDDEAHRRAVPKAASSTFALGLFAATLAQ